jgi:rubrerythrin
MGRVAIDLGEAVEPADAPVVSPPERAAVRIPAASSSEFADWVDFAEAGSDVSGEFRCSDCGYGAVVHQVLPPCPMCRGTVWERRTSRLTY